MIVDGKRLPNALSELMSAIILRIAGLEPWDGPEFEVNLYYHYGWVIELYSLTERAYLAVNELVKRYEKVKKDGVIFGARMRSEKRKDRALYNVKVMVIGVKKFCPGCNLKQKMYRRDRIDPLSDQIDVVYCCHCEKEHPMPKLDRNNRIKR